MNRAQRSNRLPALALAAILLLLAAPGARAQEGGAGHAHIGHILDAFPATPEGEGLLPTAEAEAATAIRHAELAAGDDSNLEWMQTHARHVLRAVDPSRVEGEEGPGLGFGVKPAAEAIAQHVGMAADTEGASGEIETHATHVVAAANSVSSRADEVAQVAQEILDAYDYSSAGSRVYELRRLARQLQTGVDADEDGQISWRAPEGGLAQVRRHMELMADAEGL